MATEQREIIDETDLPIQDNSDAMSQALQVNDLRDKPKLPLQYHVSEQDIAAGKNFCKEIVTTIITAKLPPAIAKQPEMMQIVDLQRSFEEFSLQSMFAVVAQAMRLLTTLTVEDAIYTPEGLLDTFKLQAVLATQQHCMNLIAQFNTHVRRLPGVLADMLNDLEYSQIQTVEVLPIAEQDGKGTVTAKPISVILNDLQKKQEAEKAQQTATDAEFVETSEQAATEQEPITEEESELETIDLPE